MMLLFAVLAGSAAAYDICGSGTHCGDRCWMGSQNRWGKCDTNHYCVNGPVQCGSADVCGSGAHCNDQCWMGSVQRWGKCDLARNCVDGPVACGTPPGPSPGSAVCGAGTKCNDQCWISSAGVWGRCDIYHNCVYGSVQCPSSDKALCQQPMHCGQQCWTNTGASGQCTDNWEMFQGQWYRTCESPPVYCSRRSEGEGMAALPIAMIVAVAAALLLAAVAAVYKVRSKSYAPLANDETVTVTAE